MKPGDLVSVVVLKDYLDRDQRIQGIPALLTELIPGTNICIIMAQGRQWTSTLDQLELVDEAR